MVFQGERNSTRANVFDAVLSWNASPVRRMPLTTSKEVSETRWAARFSTLSWPLLKLIFCETASWESRCASTSPLWKSGAAVLGKIHRTFPRFDYLIFLMDLNVLGASDVITEPRAYSLTSLCLHVPEKMRIL